MFVVQINLMDRSIHTKETDAEAQKIRFIENGTNENTILVVQKDTFSPPDDII